MSLSRRERREQRRWRKEMLRRLEELDRVDREQGLGAMPLGTGPPAPEPRRHRRSRRGRRTTGPVLPGLLISALIAGLVMFNNPGMTGYRFRQLVDHLTGAADGSYAFVVETSAGDPVGWNPCQPIRYQVNPEGAPDGWEETVESGVREIAEASGFDFTYNGTTDDRTFSDRPFEAGNPPPVLIGWADSLEVPDLAGSTAGIGGSTPMRSGNRIRFVTGVVVLDTDAYDRMAMTGDDTGARLILAHELGHVLGLDHVDDVDELMNDKYSGQTGFGSGDIEGMQRLRDLPC